MRAGFWSRWRKTAGPAAKRRWRRILGQECGPTATDAFGVRRYRRKPDTWPPPDEYLHSGPIGLLPDVVYLQVHIEHARAELEAREGVYSLDYTDDNGAEGSREAHSPLVAGGKWWQSRVNHEQCDLDLSRMDLDWVAHTEDPLFSGLSRVERLVLYLVFVREFSWEKLGDALQVLPKAPGRPVIMPAARSRL